MAVPFGGRPRQPAIEAMRQLYAERFHYIVYFQEPGLAEAEMDADIPRTLRMMMHNSSAAVPRDHFLQDKPAGAGLFEGMQDPGTLPTWCDHAAFDHYVKTFEGRGFYGALNWYRNFERNWQRTAALADRQIEQPALFLLGDMDPVGTLEAYTLKQMPKRIARLEQHVLKDCGHWIQNERAEQVNQLLLAFLSRHYLA
jgi:pimeloyl-ACP methyl ester carboxylesterase